MTAATLIARVWVRWRRSSLLRRMPVTSSRRPLSPSRHIGVDAIIVTELKFGNDSGIYWALILYVPTTPRLTMLQKPSIVGVNRTNHVLAFARVNRRVLKTGR